MNHGQARIPDGDVILYDDRDEACRYQIARIREWAKGGGLTFVPISDPRVLLWYGEDDETLPPGIIAFIGSDGTQVRGAEALEWIIHRLPSGRSAMLAAMPGEGVRGRTKRPYSGLTGELNKDRGATPRSGGLRTGDGASYRQPDRMEH